MICYAQLVAKETDYADYTTYVFQVLDEVIINEIKSLYVMCVQWPNWQQDKIELGDKGYLKYKEVRAGVDEWYDGTAHNFYKYSNVIFEKFVKCEALNTKEVLL